MLGLPAATAIAAGASTAPGLALHHLPALPSTLAAEITELWRLHERHQNAVEKSDDDRAGMSEWTNLEAACETAVDAPVKGWPDLVRLAMVVKVGAEDLCDLPNYCSLTATGEEALEQLVERILELGGVAV